MHGIIFHIPASITFSFSSAFILQTVPILLSSKKKKSLITFSCYLLPFIFMSLPTFLYFISLHLFHIYTKMYRVLHMKKLGDDTILIVMTNIFILADSKIAGAKFSAWLQGIFYNGLKEVLMLTQIWPPLFWHPGLYLMEEGC